MPIYGNRIHIDRSGLIEVIMSDVLDDNGSSKAIRDFLEPWISNYKFQNSQDEFNKLISESKDIFLNINSFNDKEKIIQVIGLLNESLKYIKILK